MKDQIVSVEVIVADDRKLKVTGPWAKLKNWVLNADAKEVAVPDTKGVTVNLDDWKVVQGKVAEPTEIKQSTPVGKGSKSKRQGGGCAEFKF